MYRNERTDGLKCLVARDLAGGQTVCRVCVLQPVSTDSSGCYQTISVANKAAKASVCSELRAH